MFKYILCCCWFKFKWNRCLWRLENYFELPHGSRNLSCLLFEEIIEVSGIFKSQRISNFSHAPISVLQKCFCFVNHSTRDKVVVDLPVIFLTELFKWLIWTDKLLAKSWAVFSCNGCSTLSIGNCLSRNSRKTEVIRCAAFLSFGGRHWWQPWVDERWSREDF